MSVWITLDCRSYREWYGICVYPCGGKGEEASQYHYHSRLSRTKLANSYCYRCELVWKTMIGGIRWRYSFVSHMNIACCFFEGIGGDVVSCAATFCEELCPFVVPGSAWLGLKYQIQPVCDEGNNICLFVFCLHHTWDESGSDNSLIDIMRLFLIDYILSNKSLDLTTWST